jgi:hypothetical protein
MFQRLVVTLVEWCWQRAVWVVIASAVITGCLGWYAATHLELDTDESRMISANLPFRKAEREFDRAFPQNADLLAIVVDAQTPAQADDAVSRLQDRLETRPDLFFSLRRPAEDVFFHTNGLLFLSTEELTDLSDHLVRAQPFMGSLARDSSLQGLLSALDLLAEGVVRQQIGIADLTPMLNAVDAVAAQVSAGQPAKLLDWQNLFGGSAAKDTPRRFLLAQPVLHYGNLVAGAPATMAIRRAADELGLDAQHGIRVRLTGSVALSDANFATVSSGVEVSAPLSLVAVCLLLFLAVRSRRVVVAILLSLVVGLVATAAFAAATVGTLNPISVAFAVMFVGIAVDFAIQFVVRYRHERFLNDEAQGAMIACARGMAAPLSLAAVATAVGFLSFLPTAYSGVSQLGLIAGGGMLIALVVDFTVLPALLSLFRPPPEKAPVGFPLGAADRWVNRHGRTIVVAAGLLGLVGAAALPSLPLDFNPLHLQNPKDEAVSTFLELAKDPNSGSYSIDVLTPSLQAAQALADKLDRLPDVERTMTLESFVPDDQGEKLAIVGDLASLLAPTLSPAVTLPPPTGYQLVAALSATADKLDGLGGPESAASRLAQHFRAVVSAGPQAAMALSQALTGELPSQLAALRRSLSVGPITLANLPDDLKHEWLAADGRARVQVVPKGQLQTDKAITRFVKDVRGLAPNATGLPVAVEQSAKVVVNAFGQAGLAALAAIAVLLGFMLRRWLDALLVLLPLVMGSLYTVIAVVLSGLAINFANIIALPLLLGIGVAFNIYFVVNWRNGLTDHLQSSTTRAVLFSALTTGMAFGSLAVSPHLGTASMGLLLFLSLAFSVATTFVVLPAIFSCLARWQR